MPTWLDVTTFFVNAWYFLLLVPLLHWWGFHEDRPLMPRHPYARPS